jgi:hypothetical protein
MKVERLIEILQKGYKGTDDLCVLWWSKPEVDNLDDTTLTDESWAKICLEFDEWQDADTAISEWIVNAVIEHSEED